MLIDGSWRKSCPPNLVDAVRLNGGINELCHELPFEILQLSEIYGQSGIKKRFFYLQEELLCADCQSFFLGCDKVLRLMILATGWRDRSWNMGTSSCPTSAMNAYTSYPCSINQARIQDVSDMIQRMLRCHLSRSTHPNHQSRPAIHVQLSQPWSDEI